jgi:hypothetical protein
VRGVVAKGCHTSLWIRNLQLGAWGAVLGVASVVAKDGPSVRNLGFFHGYDK